MEYNDLCDPMKRLLDNELDSASSSIGDDIRDAIEDSDEEADFVASAVRRLGDLKSECDDWIAKLTRAKEAV